MQKTEIYLNPVILALLKFAVIFLIALFSYMREESFFLVSFVFCLAVIFGEMKLEEEGYLRNTTLREISNILLFFVLSASYYLFFPQFSSSVFIVFILVILVYIFNRFFSYLKFGKVLFLQHISFRAAILSGIAFILVTMLTGNPHMVLFTILAVIVFFSIIEEFLILRKMQYPEEKIDSIFKKE